MAYRWTATSGFVELGALSGDTRSIARAVSADGSVVVGWSEPSEKAFRWTQETGMVGLGALPGCRKSLALGVSGDGSVIVGQSDDRSGPEACIWDASHGMRSVAQVLTELPNPGKGRCAWKLRAASAVSRDGSVVAGWGINPDGDREAWIARLSDDPSTDASESKIARPTEREKGDSNE
jgi:probable HAF family extracellular repeat protein